ncbi:MAG: hypothetical protein HRF50_04105 [Phycisphaerae bacterium]|jgi:hypothetical protein
MFTLAELNEAAVVVIAIAAGCFVIYQAIRQTFNYLSREHAARIEAAANENQDRLKALMVQRGMSADEIVRVLAARFVPPRLAEPAPSGTDAEERIVKTLSDNGYDGKDIERILVAGRVNDRIDERTAALVQTLADNWTDAADIARILEARRSAAPVG